MRREEKKGKTKNCNTTTSSSSSAEICKKMFINENFLKNKNWIGNCC